MNWIRFLIARWRLVNAEFDVEYWRSAVKIAEHNLHRAQRRADSLRQLPLRLRFKLPRGVRQ